MIKNRNIVMLARAMETADTLYSMMAGEEAKCLSVN